MGVYTNTIPNLLAGVSQQAPQLRLSTQSETQINVMSSLTKGMGKRPPAILNKVIGTIAGASTSFIHDINRDAAEQYAVLMVDGDLSVYDRRTGIAQTVNFESIVYTSLTAQAAIGNGTAYQVKLRPGDTSMSIITTGIAGGATVLLQESTTGLWAGEETTKSTITTDTTTVVATLTHDRYYRLRKSVAGTGSATGTMTWKPADYLDVATPRTDFAAITVADNTFIVNKTVTAAMAATLSTTRNPEALVNVIAGNYGREYSLYVDGTRAAKYFTLDGLDRSHVSMSDTKAIATTLAYALDNTVSGLATFAMAGVTGFTSPLAGDNYSNVTGTNALDAATWTVTQMMNVLHITRVNGAAFDIYGTDGANQTSMKVIKGSTQRFSDLPVRAPDGYHVEITGESSNNFDNYYVKFVKSQTSDNGEGTWVETLAQGIKTTIDAATMPHLLVRESDGTFTFKKATWDNRAVGDESRNPEPSFIGQKIRDVSFFRNRLMLAAGENTIGSRSGDPFNFWRSTVTTVLDTDPIDVGSTAPQVSTTNYMTPVNDNLLLWSDQIQSRISGGELLSPKSVGNKVLSAYPMDSNCRPAFVGDKVFFTKTEGASSSIREYWLDADTGSIKQLETTNHCPAFVPSNVYEIKASGICNMALALSATHTDRLYVYKYYWSDTQKAQSAWSYWQLATGTTIVGCMFFDTDLVLVTMFGGAVHLVTIPLEADYKDTGCNFPILLDHRVISTDLVAGSYDAGLNRTSYTLPYAATGVEAWTAYDAGGPYQPGLEFQVDSVSTTTIRLSGNTTASVIYFGLPYTMTHKFSDLYIRKEMPGGGQMSLTDGRTQVLRMTLNYADTGSFAVGVIPEARNTSTYAYTALGSTIDDPDYLLDEVVLETGKFSFPVKCQNNKVSITVTNDDALPCWFLSADWLSTYQPKHKRV